MRQRKLLCPKLRGWDGVPREGDSSQQGWQPMGLCLLAVGPRDCCHHRVQIPSSMGKGEASCLACQRRRDKGSWRKQPPREKEEAGIPCGQLQKMRDPLPSARSSRSLGKARSGSAVLTLGTPAVRLKFPSQHPSVAGCFFAALCKSRSWQKHQHQKPCRPAQARRGDLTVAVLPNRWQQEGRWSCWQHWWQCMSWRSVMPKSHSRSPEEVSLLSGTISRCSFWVYGQAEKNPLADVVPLCSIEAGNFSRTNRPQSQIHRDPHMQMEWAQRCRLTFPGCQLCEWSPWSEWLGLDDFL